MAKGINQGNYFDIRECNMKLEQQQKEKPLEKVTFQSFLDFHNLEK